jgi:hypothetical protein
VGGDTMGQQGRRLGRRWLVDGGVGLEGAGWRVLLEEEVEEGGRD